MPVGHVASEQPFSICNQFRSIPVFSLLRPVALAVEALRKGSKKRLASLVNGLLLQVQDLRMQQEIEKSEGENAVLVPARFDPVLDDDNLLE